MISGSSRTTICIPTLNRPQFIARTLEYYAREGFQGSIAIGDGSSPENVKAIREVCESFRSKLKVQLLELPDVTQPMVLAALANIVETEFSAYSGDDDFLIPETIMRCETILDEDPRFVAARGRGIVVNMNGVHGIPFETERYNLPIWPQALSIDRVQAFFRNYAVNIFCLHRSTAWRRMWSTCAPMEDKAIGAEIGPGAISAALGRIAVIDDLYLIRQIHTQYYQLPSGRAWFLSPAFQQSARLLTDQLFEIVLEQDMPTAEARKSLLERIWTSFMLYLSPVSLPGDYGWLTSQQVKETKDAKLGILLTKANELTRHFLPILRSLIGEKTAQDTRPKLLLSWGNPYVLEETIGPLLPELSRHFWILLLLVDYRLTPEVRNRAKGWKDSGLISDVLIAPSHGGTLDAHHYIAELLPMLRALDFDIFLSISAMQPYERYIIDCALPKNCLRILLWPHPTNLFFLYPELVEAVRIRSRSAIDLAIKKYRALREPRALVELMVPGRYNLRVLAALVQGLFAQWVRLHGQLVIDYVKVILEIFGTNTTTDKKIRSRSVKPKVVPAKHSLQLPMSRAERMGRFLIQIHGLSYIWRKIKKWWPRLATAIHKCTLALKFAVPTMPPLQISQTLAQNSRFLRGVSLVELGKRFPQICDRFIYPQIMVGRWFPFRKLDFLTQIGTDQFDACMFYNEIDAEAHKVLFENPNMYAVRYATRTAVDPAQAINAILMPFTLHSSTDMTPTMLDLYARDLKIALKESGATEVHLRPHPGRPEDWLESLASGIRERGVPCILTAAEKPIGEAAARYRGVVGAVSASLRDVRLACPHIFVVGSMGLSITHIENPKLYIGFADSIGWIEADGSYDPAIFRPVEERSQNLPSAVDVILSLHNGDWNRLPKRLAAPVQS